MSTVRTYNPSVRVGNWYEDCQLEEDTIKNFLERKDRGELVSQRVGKLFQSVSSSQLGSDAHVQSVSPDGLLRFGDSVQLINPGSDMNLVRLGRASSRSATALSIAIGEEMLINSSDRGIPDPCPSSASFNSLKPMARNLFTVVACDGTPLGQTLRYGQSFQLCTQSCLGNILYLSSDSIKFGDTPKKHGNQPVKFVSDSSFQTRWKVEFFNPQLRMEFEGAEVPVNEKVILKHVKTNQTLAVEEKFTVRGLFGEELDVSARTFLDDHKAERDVNHWVFASSIPEGASGTH